MQRDKTTNMTNMTISEAMAKWWGYKEFRPNQREVMERVMAGGDTLALMPTGAGKSLLYQVPTMAREGLCIVVTPLVALMKDQVDNLQRRGIKAVALHSGLSSRNIDIILDNCVYGDVKFLYVAPERLSNEVFRVRVAKMKVSLIAVDEAHCISQWGYDFRPSYLEISQLRAILPDVPILALTASATDKVAKDVMRLLRFDEEVVMRSSYARPNLSYVVRRCDDKNEHLSRVLSNVEGAAIVYVRSRERSAKVCEWLTERGFSAQFYHAGLPHEERAIRQDEWQRGTKRIMVATNAFGMGIDKQDVRAVVHYDMCSSLEAYYQEAGRAGRDGKRSYAVLLIEGDEERVATRRVECDFPPLESVKRVYDEICARMMIAYGEGGGVAREFNAYEFARDMGMTVEMVRNSIKLLAQNGYMTLSEERENRARLMFCVSREDLYDYRIRSGQAEMVLLAVLRLYEGVFSDFRPIDVHQIANYCGCDVERVRDELKTLWRQHIIRYVPSSFSPILTLLCDRVPKRDLYIAPDSYLFRRQSAEERMEAMMNYALLEDGCRSSYIEEYFGESETKPCGVCDNCIARRKRDAAASLGVVGERAVTPERVVEIIAERDGISPRDLCREFCADSSRVAEVVEELMEREKIYTDRGGILRIKR